jgi:hypothetical protein
MRQSGKKKLDEARLWECWHTVDTKTGSTRTVKESPTALYKLSAANVTHSVPSCSTPAPHKAHGMSKSARHFLRFTHIWGECANILTNDTKMPKQGSKGLLAIRDQ